MIGAKNIKGFIITASHEIERRKNVSLLQSQLPAIELVEAIYPSKEKIPFLKQLQLLSKERTGIQLNPGEIGIILSNRKVWQRILAIAKNEKEMFLILESDSIINDLKVLQQSFQKIASEFDLFFFGAWLGHVKLLRSKKKQLTDKYQYGEPFIKTISGGYGYALNKTTANILLKKTKKIAHPVDEFKRYMSFENIKIGAVTPELISHANYTTTIGHKGNKFLKKCWVFLLDIRNEVISNLK